MVSKDSGGFLSGSASDVSSDSELSDNHLDSLVDDIIGKLSIYPDYNKRSMTIKNRKERVKSDRPCDWDVASTSGSSRHSHGYKPYAYPEERKETSHRVRVRPGHQHESVVDYGAVKDPVEVGPPPLAYTPYPLRDTNVFPNFPCSQQRHRGTPQQAETLSNSLECRPSVGSNPKSPPSSPHEKDTGNNSEDEYYPGTNIRRDPLSQVEETSLEKLLMEKKGWKIVKVQADGACLFRSVSHQIFGDEEKHDVVRNQVVDYMLKNKEHFSPYITEDFDRYICRKRNATCYGNHVEIQAIAELYNRPVEIYHDSVEPINVFHAEYSKEFPIRLSYHGRVHYNSVVDPFKPAFGYGLGMPNYQPTLAEPDLISQAIKESEATQLEEAMLRDKLAETEQSEIDRCMEAQAVRESYFEYLSQLKLPVNTVGSTTSDLPPGALASPGPTPTFPSRTSPSVASSSTSTLPPSLRLENSSTMPLTGYQQRHHIPSELRGLDEDTLVAMVMEQSRQEYLECLRRKRTSPSPPRENDGSPCVATTPSASHSLPNAGRSPSPNPNSGTQALPANRHSD